MERIGKPSSRARRAAGADGEGYRFVLSGPNSVLRRTRAYGVDFARFLAHVSLFEL